MESAAGSTTRTSSALFSSQVRRSHNFLRTYGKFEASFGTQWTSTATNEAAHIASAVRQQTKESKTRYMTRKLYQVSQDVQSRAYCSMTRFPFLVLKALGDQRLAPPFDF